MNFFEHQEDARQRSRWLLVYFLLALLLIVAAINAAAAVLLILSGDQSIPPRQWFEHWASQPWWMAVSAGTLLVIAAGSLWRSRQLGRGGDAIAEWAGARPLEMSSAKPAERQYINVVEEMAIASGSPMPSLWVMQHESGINAFVAGLSPYDAALVITRGCLEQLDRDELQGVVAHEFSHIFNGDMRLNLRLMGVLAGITLLGQMGGWLLRSTGSGVSRSRAGAQAYALVLGGGAALLLVGWIGLFFARLIKASVSRQREFLADASAVQYTRNPQGLAGALARIRNYSFGSGILHSHAEEMSHLCFGASLPQRLSGAFATHPPLDERIARIDPHFELRQRSRERRERAQSQPPDDSVSRSMERLGLAALSQEVIGVNAAAVAASVGEPRPEHLAYARALYGAIPDTLQMALHDGVAARRALLALVLGPEPESESGEDARRNAECERLIAAAEGTAGLRETQRLRRLIGGQWARMRLALVDLALPQLKRLPEGERATFLELLKQLIAADGRVSLFEFTLLAILERLFQPPPKVRGESLFSYAEAAGEIALLLSLTLRAGESATRHRADGDQRYASLLRSFTTRIIPRDSLPAASGARFQAALRKLQRLAPMLKAPLIEALVDCVLEDGHITIREAELLRAIAESLDCPLPPLIDMRAAPTA